MIGLTTIKLVSVIHVIRVIFWAIVQKKTSGRRSEAALQQRLQLHRVIQRVSMVSRKDIKTYDHGFEFDVQTPITKDGIVKICRSLEARFGPGNVFEPEAITDGFIAWKNWPERNEEVDAYKCIRCSPINTCGARGQQSNKWPWVDSNVMTTWNGNQDVAFKTGRYATFLKALHNVEPWSQTQLRTVQECLTENDISIVRKRKRARSNV